MSEKLLEKILISNFKSLNFYVKKVSVLNMPGFPDMLIVNNDTIILIELKEIEFKRDFKLYQNKGVRKTQPPFWFDYLNKSNSNNLFLLIRAVKNYKREFCIVQITKNFIKNIDKITYNTIDKYSERHFITTKFFNIVNWLLTFLKWETITFEIPESR